MRIFTCKSFGVWFVYKKSGEFLRTFYIEIRLIWVIFDDSGWGVGEKLYYDFLRRAGRFGAASCASISFFASSADNEAASVALGIL